jgi:hypothetical protein
MQKKSSKKTSQRTKKRVRRVSPALRARALAIINSDAYDQDSREGIANVLNERKADLSDLTDLVQRVENGEEFWDLVGADRKMKDEALLVYRFLTSPNLQPWLQEVVLDALQKAATRKDLGDDVFIINLNDHSPSNKKIALNSLVLLFTHARGMPGYFSLRLSPYDRVAGAVHELISNQLTPTTLYDQVRDFITSTLGHKPKKLPQHCNRSIREGTSMMDLWSTDLKTIAEALDFANMVDSQEAQR